MKGNLRSHSLGICLLMSLLFLSTNAWSQSRKKTNLNQDWRFRLGDPDEAYFSPETDDSQWEQVHLPHTLALTSLTLDDLADEKTQLLFHRNVGWYRKDLEISSDMEKKIFLEFEGAHQITDLWVNGTHVGQHAVGGYTPFHFDISSFVKRGAVNQITLLVDNRRYDHIPPDPGPFDYVKFSGLYRDVYLVETSPLHITFNWEALKAGVYITTPTVDPVNMNASIRIKTVIRNEYSSDKTCLLTTRIMDKRGLVVLKLNQESEIQAGQDFEFDQIGSIEDDLHLWEIDDPYLYRVQSEVICEGQSLDILENKLGIRKFHLDPTQGFMLNDRPIELLGYNRHQQFPYVGDAVPNSLHYKDMLQFKELGFNIVRTAHYPQDDALIDACDELGILVYEEAPSWISMSNNPLWWDNFEQAARVMVRNHRNHPSVVIWGAGINHRGYVARAHNAVKQEDPVRLTASQGSRWTGWQSSGLTDINANMLYGPFIWDRSEPMFAMEGRSGPAEVAKHKRDPLMAGLISWTAHAYYTFHPNHVKAKDPRDRTRSGAMTIFRYPRRNIMWYSAELKEEPFIFVKEAWTSESKQLTVFSNGEEVELSVNGQVLAKQGPSEDTTFAGLDHPPFFFEIDQFQAGTLTAKAIMDGQVIAQTQIQTPEKAAAIRIDLDTAGRSFVADGSDILLAYAHVVDKHGTTLLDADYQIQFEIEGPASIVGDKADIQANPMFTEYGVAPVLIRAATKAGKIELKASGRGLRSDRISFESTVNAPFSPAPVYDFEAVRVDMGAPDQLVQFDWTAWNNVDNQSSEKEFSDMGGFTASLRSGSPSGVLRWLGEMNVIGKYGFVYGDGVLGIDQEGILLTFTGLVAGRYRLTSWHHAPKSNTDSMDPNKDKLKEVNIHKIPFERQIQVSLQGNSVGSIAVTEGKNRQFEPPATHQILFQSDGKSPVQIRFSSPDQAGIWLNGFELSEWDVSLEE